MGKVGPQREATIASTILPAMVASSLYLSATCFDFLCRNTNVTNLVWLTSEQALNDLAVFVVAMTQKYKLQGAK